MSGKNEKAPIDKVKAINVIKNLISKKDACLNTKYLKSHEKIAIFYNSHIIEINGGEEKFIKYMSFTIPLSSKEHKEILGLFVTEVKKRNEEISLKKLEDFRHLTDE